MTDIFAHAKVPSFWVEEVLMCFGQAVGCLSWFDRVVRWQRIDPICRLSRSCYHMQIPDTMLRVDDQSIPKCIPKAT